MKGSEKTMNAVVYKTYIEQVQKQGVEFLPLPSEQRMRDLFGLLDLAATVELFYRHCGGMSEHGADPRNELHINPLSEIIKDNQEYLVKSLGPEVAKEYNGIGNTIVWSAAVLVKKGRFASKECSVYTLYDGEPLKAFETFEEFILTASEGEFIF